MRVTIESRQCADPSADGTARCRPAARSRTGAGLPDQRRPCHQVAPRAAAGSSGAITVLTLAVFLVVILTGLFGTPAGNHNFGIIYVWLVWWAVLKLVLIPVFGRFWCSVCPIPAPGDWLQRRRMIVPAAGRQALHLRQDMALQEDRSPRLAPLAQVPAQHLGAELRLPGHRALLGADPDQPARHGASP